MSEGMSELDKRMGELEDDRSAFETTVISSFDDVEQHLSDQDAKLNKIIDMQGKMMDLMAVAVAGVMMHHERQRLTEADLAEYAIQMGFDISDNPLLLTDRSKNPSGPIGARRKAS